MITVMQAVQQRLCNYLAVVATFLIRANYSGLLDWLFHAGIQ